MANEKLTTAGNIADLLSLFFDFKNWASISKIGSLFRRGRAATDSGGPLTPEPNAASPNTPSGDTTWSNRDNRAFATLETMFSRQPTPGPRGARAFTVSDTQRAAFGLFASLLTSGEGGALENVFTLADGKGGERVRVRLVWIVPTGTVGIPPGPKWQSYHMWTRPRGVNIYCGIADDILKGVNPAEQLARAQALVRHLRRLGVLDNLTDDTIKAARQAKLLVSQADTLGHETRAQMKLGFNGRLWAELMADTEIKTKEGEIKAAEPLDAIRLHEEYQQLLLEKTTAIVERELGRRRWSFFRWRVTVRGFNIHVPLVRPGWPSRALAISLISIGIIIWFFVTLGSNA